MDGSYLINKLNKTLLCFIFIQLKNILDILIKNKKIIIIENF